MIPSRGRTLLELSLQHSHPSSSTGEIIGRKELQANEVVKTSKIERSTVNECSPSTSGFSLSVHSENNSTGKHLETSVSCSSPNEAGIQLRNFMPNMKGRSDLETSVDSSEGDHSSDESWVPDDNQHAKKIKRWEHCLGDDPESSGHEENIVGENVNKSVVYESVPHDECPEENVVGESGMRKKPKKAKKLTRKERVKKGKDKKMRDNPCKEGKCKNKCWVIPDADRLQIFNNYWGMDSNEEKNNWLLSCVRESPVKRRRITTGESRRTITRHYKICYHGVEREVCLQFILKTLDISHRKVSYVKENATAVNSAPKDRRGKHSPKNKTSLEKKNSVIAFIKRLPAVPSHYCRNQSTRKYLPVEYRSLAHVYRIYKKQTEKNMQVEEGVFRSIFKKDFNIGFHLPKKDKCAFCESIKETEQERLTDDERTKLADHLNLKNSAKNTFLEDQTRAATDSSYVCASFDLEKVLNTPHGESMLLYYSRKYAFYNLTVYESKTCNAFCYVWGETDGHRGANEICSAVSKYLRMVDSRGGVTDISLYCDSCPGQNKNRQMISMIYCVLQNLTSVVSIKLTFLLPGHTYMPVDSVHACIDKFTKKRIIWAPSEWPTIIANSRINPGPYEVIRMSFKDFKDWKVIADSYIPSTGRGTKIHFKELRSVSFTKGSAHISLRDAFDETVEPHRVPLNCNQGNSARNVGTSDPPMLYKNRLPMSAAKYRDLKNLYMKNVIPERFHDEYTALPYSGKSKDTLAETDEEDETVEED